jgi:carbon storage regulator
MLVLSRRETERVRLGDSIVLTIVRVSGDKVRLGIEAPPNVLVLRDELQVHDPAAGAGVELEVDAASVPLRKAA